MIVLVSPERQWEEAGEQEEDEERIQEQESEQECEEAARARVIKAEDAPSKREIEERMATHMPFRSWCPFCVAGEAVNSGHRRNPEGPGLVPIVSIDYAFMGKGQVNNEGAAAGSEDDADEDAQTL